MKLPDAPWQDGEDMRRLLATLGSAEGDTRFVGGCVRDTMFGIPVADVDLATRLLPEEVIRRLEEARIKAVPTGLAHGTVTAVIRGKPVEVTTLRRDVSTDGRRATVAFTDDWREDAGRRDFTINALSADPASGEIFDYFGGLDDLEARRVRFIGDPLTRIAEDHLRILRFFRFYARFGEGAPDGDGLDACTRRANDLMALSRERIAGELLRLLALPDPAPTVRIMIERGILKPVLPEIDMGGVERLATLPPRERAANVAADGIRRFAALLPRGEMAADLASRLRLSNAQRARLECIERSEPDNAAPPRQLAYRIGAECAVDRLLLDPRFDAEEAAARVAALASWQSPDLPVRGGDLVAAGVTAGPDVARLLRRIEERWIGEDFPDAARARAIMEEELRSSV
ncbi:MAG: CCA tRNA nucleotidyltransferase [Allosphingosinicella sp.]|uniref:CCA tRNA nucleotidyltransferase n=1 Tax=Allosphingosinicella sp. TaxID=2823234 RepID=UPI003963C99D